MSKIQNIENQHTSGVYAKRELTIVRGEGATLYDEDGNAYIDCVGGQGAANLGHAHPKVVAAITEQAQKIISCPEMFYNDTRAALLEKLTSLAPEGMDRAFLSNSGTEAVEAAFKFARFSTKRTDIIATMRGFHGRSMGALSATWNKKYRAPFQPLVPGIKHVPYNKLEKLEAAIDDNTAAVILEAVQGEGGVHPGDAEYLLGAQKLCNERGAMLIMDEIQTGFGRTGKIFAIDRYGIKPDIMAVAKSMAGGFPMGATLLGENVAELDKGIHGSTFGGNPLAAAASLAALNALVDEKLPERAAELGSYLVEELKKIESPLIRGVRGMGLMVGIEIKKKVAPYLKELTARGVLALPAGMTVLRLLPPLVIEKEQLDEVVAVLKEVLAE
ncbi:MAG: aspartate aminotransferase family protein [Chloroflexi bacterium]|nr:aspartate aminotransferase family protein [Chloroflexota bacterium]